MQKSEQINEIADALSKAQGEMMGAEKDHVNPHFRSKYADLASVWSACRTALTKHGIAVAQPIDSDDAGKVFVETMLLHSSGQYITGRFSIQPGKPDAHGVGSAITYMRRYALAAMVGVAPDDDDGNAASQPAGNANAKSAAPAQQDEAAVRAEAFADRHIANLAVCKTLAEVDKVTHENEGHVQALETRYPDAFERVKAVWAERVKALSADQEAAQ